MPKRRLPVDCPLRVLSIDPGMRNLGVVRATVSREKPLVREVETMGVHDILEVTGVRATTSCRSFPADKTVLAALAAVTLRHPDWLSEKPDIVVIESQIGKKEASVAAALLAAASTAFPTADCFYMGAMGKFKVGGRPALDGPKHRRHTTLKNAAISQAQSLLDHLPDTCAEFEALRTKREHVADCLLQAVSAAALPRAKRIRPSNQ